MNRIFDKIRSAVESQGFFTQSDYTLFEHGSIPEKDRYPHGFLAGSTTSSLAGDKNQDLNNYLEMIRTTSKKVMEAEPANGNFDAWSDLGILHPKKDVNGIIRKKYDIVIKGMESLGIDIQAIGELYN